jgi:hypothetical protein
VHGTGLGASPVTGFGIGGVELSGCPTTKVKLSLCLTKDHDMKTHSLRNLVPRMKTYWVMEVELHAFIGLALDGGMWSASRPGRFTPEVRTPRYPLRRKLSGPQSPSGCCGGDKSHHCPCR